MDPPQGRSLGQLPRRYQRHCSSSDKDNVKASLPVAAVCKGSGGGPTQSGQIRGNDVEMKSESQARNELVPGGHEVAGQRTCTTKGATQGDCGLGGRRGVQVQQEQARTGSRVGEGAAGPPAVAFFPLGGHAPQ